MKETLLRQIAPTGPLRASINLGNPVLAGRDAVSGEPCGVSVDLAQALAKRLGLSLQLLVFESAGKSVDAVARGEADIGFFALDPQRAGQVRFTAPYVLIEGAYVVRESSPVRSMADVDVAGQRVMVGQGSAYDLFLTRELRHATVVRADTSPTVVDEYLQGDVEIAAGVRQQLEADCRRLGGLRILPGSFMVIKQAMGIPADRSDAALGEVWEFLETMKAKGFVARSLERQGINGAAIAPPQAIQRLAQ